MISVCFRGNAPNAALLTHQHFRTSANISIPFTLFAAKHQEQAQKSRAKADAQWVDDDTDAQRKDERREKRDRKAAELVARKQEAK